LAFYTVAEKKITDKKYVENIFFTAFGFFAMAGMGAHVGFRFS
jgi:hypothetical protein